MTAGIKLVIGTAVVVATTIYLAFIGASSSWQYYLTVDECLADQSAFTGKGLRINGRIAADSLRIDRNQMHANFILEGNAGSLAVTCEGQLPDNLAEGLDVVVEGRLSGAQHVRADRVITKCASKYRSTTANDVTEHEPTQSTQVTGSARDTNLR